MKPKAYRTNLSRNELPALIKEGGKAIELGVWKGTYSEIIMAKSKDVSLYSVDRWAGDRGHDGREEKEARDKLAKYPKCVVIKESFDKMLERVKENNEKFDFVYLDGYAHEGQGSLSHFFDWLGVVEVGGIFAGHDYDECFPIQVENIDTFFKQTQLPFFLTSEKKYPSFFTFKR